jgi:pSer/pThr/pTyr-binding forkhead associated (FHA) protein
VSELTLAVIKLGFLTVLWLLVLSVTSAMRADLFGVRPAKGTKPQRTNQRQPKGNKGVPGRAVIVEGPDAGRQIPLQEGTQVTFGRGASCNAPLSDEYISTQHARLRFQDGRWFVEDLGSTNGTYIGNQQIKRATPVSPKVRFRLGKTVVELRK